MKTFLSFAEHHLIYVPIVALFSTFAYGAVILFALVKKDCVKASVWHRTSGFSIDAHNDRSKRRE
jgi:hypothetical protein